MREKEATIYFCDHCNKLYQRKHYCEKHEKRCFQNPENERKCWSCKHRSQENAIWYEDSYGHEVTRSMDMSYCNKIGSFIYPPITEHKGNAIDLGEERNVPMRKDCEDYEFDFYDMEEIFE